VRSYPDSRVERGEQVHRTVGASAGAAGALAVHRDHPPRPGWWAGSSCAGVNPAAEDLVQLVVVDALQAPPDGRLRRRPARPRPSGSRTRGWQVGGPLGDGHVRGRSGQHRAHRDAKDGGEPVPYPATVPRIADRGQRLEQAVRDGVDGLRLDMDVAGQDGTSEYTGAGAAPASMIKVV
jgi:hypothetical protein